MSHRTQSSKLSRSLPLPLILALLFPLIMMAVLGGRISANPGLAWSPMASGTASDLNGVWGSEANDVFTVGDNGAILRFDGLSWSSMSSNTATNLKAVWGSSASDVFAVGDGGTILHYDGSAWSDMDSDTAGDLNGVCGNNAADVYAVGAGGTIQHYNGVNWSTMESNTVSDLYGILVSPNYVLAVGAGGTLVLYDMPVWVPSSITVSDLYVIFETTPVDVFAIGASGTILHFSGDEWSVMESNTASRLNCVWGIQGDIFNDVFAVGANGTVRHFDGVNWTGITSGVTAGLNGVWGSSPFNVFAVGAGGTILRYADDMVAPAAAITYSPAGPYKPGDSVNITAAFDEAMADLPVPQIAISGNNTLAAADMTKIDYTHYYYVYTVGAGNGAATVSLSAGTDLGGNEITPAPVSGAGFTVDDTPPELTAVTISSDFLDPGVAGIGDNVTLTIIADEDLLPPVVFIGEPPATVSMGPDASNWTATRLMTSSDIDGAVTFTIVFSDFAGNAGTPVTAVTDASAVFFDGTAPITASITAPANGAAYTAGTMPAGFSGTVADNTGGSGLDTNSSAFTLRRASDNRYWDGGAWVVAAAWLVVSHDATLGDTPMVWISNIAWPVWADGTYTVQVMTADKAGNTFTGAAISFQYYTPAPPPPPPPPVTTTTTGTTTPTPTDNTTSTPAEIIPPPPTETTTPPPAETTTTTQTTTTAAPPETTTPAPPEPTTLVFVPTETPPPQTETTTPAPTPSLTPADFFYTILDSIDVSTTVGGTPVSDNVADTRNAVRRLTLVNSLFSGGTLPWYVTQTIDARTLAGGLLSGGAFLPAILGRFMRRHRR